MKYNHINMNLFGNNNNNNIDDYSLIPQLVPNISGEKWYNRTKFKVGCFVTFICILSIFIFYIYFYK